MRYGSRTMSDPRRRWRVQSTRDSVICQEKPSTVVRNPCATVAGLARFFPFAPRSSWDVSLFVPLLESWGTHKSFQNHLQWQIMHQRRKIYKIDIECSKSRFGPELIDYTVLSSGLSWIIAHQFVTHTVKFEDVLSICSILQSAPHMCIAHMQELSVGDTREDNSNPTWYKNLIHVECRSDSACCLTTLYGVDAYSRTLNWNEEFSFAK